MSEEEYQKYLKRLEELKDIDNNSPYCDEFNDLHDKVITYQNENNIVDNRWL